ncbi:MAG: serine/threonine-protein kinase [Pseudomonadota bacterium]
MAIATGKRGTWWTTDWFIGVLVVLGVLLLNGVSGFFDTLEQRLYDVASTSTQRRPSERIAIIAIDDQSIANIGRWPWPRDVHAALIDKLAAANSKTIAHTAFFFEPQTDRGLPYIEKMKEVLAKPEAAGAATAAQLQEIIGEAELALDTDRILAKSMKTAGNVVIPSFFELGEPLGKSDAPLPAFAAKSAVDTIDNFAIAAVTGAQPIAVIGDSAAGVAHLDQLFEVDGAVRREPLLVDYYGQSIPSMSLLIAAKSLNLDASGVRLKPGVSVQLGKLKIKTDPVARMLPQFYKERDGKAPFAVDSFFDVMSGKIPMSKYANKIVIIGATAAGVGQSFATPAGPAMSSAEYLAHVTSSILNEHFIVQPAWGGALSIGLLALVAAYLIGGLPRLSAGKAALITLSGFTLLLVTEFGLLSASAIWLKFVFAASLLIIGHLVLTTKRFLMTEAGKLRSDEESAETNRMMGLAMQGQGQLDAAFDRFRRVPFSDALMDNLTSLALDFERKRQFNKAHAVYECMQQHDPAHKDVALKLERAKKLSETVMLGGSSHAGGTLLLDGGGVEKPMLGRYQVEKELGKGAMGVVYLGRDPKIGRVVAIKTMALSQEFEGGELDDARVRFFREAETAGRLQHQHIVTIFDAGEEHDLAYIAMEFLKGADLSEASKAPLLPVAQVVSIVARVADALAYAHLQGVVHRDIKPANIMCDFATDTVKVTDFGIARITDSSKTKTGVILGTPSYMSPEQVGGEKIDGRSDLFSLGVMLFQMLTGELPFQADSLGRLMYMIATDPAPDIRTIRPELSAQLAGIVMRAMSKKPEDRYQDGTQFAADLRADGVASTDASASASPTLESAGVPALSQAETMGKTMVLERPAAAAPTEYAATMALERVVPVAAPPALDAAQADEPEQDAPLPAHAQTMVIDRSAPTPADSEYAETVVIEQQPAPEPEPVPVPELEQVPSGHAETVLVERPETPLPDYAESVVVERSESLLSDYSETVVVERATALPADFAETVVLERAAAPPSDFAETVVVERAVALPPDFAETVVIERHAAAAPELAPAPRSAEVEVMFGPAAGRTLALTKPRTKLGRTGAQVAAIESRPDGYFLVFVEGETKPLLNGAAMDGEVKKLDHNDTMEIAGTTMRFSLKA